jgi:hypothetical protein
MTRLGPADAALAGVLVAAGVLLQLPVLAAGPVWVDEGFVLQTAAEIARGKVLFRDVISPLPGPFAFYLLAGVFELTGPSFGASRVLMAAMSSAVAGLVYLLARGATGRAAAFLAGAAFLACRTWAYPHWLMYHYATCAGLLAAAAWALAAAALARGRGGFALLAGVATGAALLAKQDVGGVTLVGLAVAALVLGGPRRLALAAAGAVGAALVVVPALLALAYAGALADFWDQAVMTAFRGFAQFPYIGRPSPWPLFAQDPFLRSRLGEYSPGVAHALYWDAFTSSRLFRDTALYDAALKVVFWAPVVALAAAALGVAASWRRPVAPPAAARRRHATLLVLYAATTQAAFNPPRDWLHLLVLYHPTLLLGALLADAAARRLRPGLRRAWIALLGAAVLAMLAVAVRVTRDFGRHYGTPVATAAGTVRVSAADAPMLRDLLAYVAARTGPADPLPVIPYYPLVSFLADRTAGMRSFIFWPVRAAGDSDARLIEDVRRSRPDVVVYSPSQYGHLGRFGENFPALFRHLVERYDLVRTFSAASPWGIVFTALAPEPPRGAPRVDLAARLDEATVHGPGGGAALAGERRAAVAGRALWPFRRVVYQRPGLGAPTAIAFRLQPPAGAELRFGWGFNPDAWVTFAPAAVDLAVGVAAAGAPERLAFAETVDAQRRPEERRWREAAIALGDAAGAEVVVTFYARTDAPAGERSDLVGWAEPRIVAAGAGE